MFNLTGIEAFCAVVKNKSFSAAARELYTSQSTISMRIKCIEDEAGMQFLVRNKSKVELTYAGEVFYKYAEKQLALSRETVEVISNLKNGDRGSFSIAASAIVNNWILQHLLKRMYAGYPNVDIVYKTCFTSEIIPRVASGKTNFGIIRTDEPEFSDSRFNQKLLERDRVLFVANVDHPIFREKDCSLEDISKSPLIIYSSNPGHSPYFKKIFGALNIFPSNVIYLNDLGAVKKITELGTHICCLSEVALHDDLVKGTFGVIPIVDYYPIYRYSQLIYRIDSEFTGAAKEFLELVNSFSVLDYTNEEVFA